MPHHDPAGDVHGSPLLLAAASTLRYFTARELAEHAGESISAARSFIRRSSFIQPLPEARDKRPGRLGRREVRWRVKPERQQQIDDYLAEFARVVNNPKADSPRMQSGPSFLELLNASLEAMADQGNSEPQDRQRTLWMVARYLSAARSDADERRALGYTVAREEDESFARAERLLADHREPPAPPIVRSDLPDWIPAEYGDASRRDFAFYLEDWTAAEPSAPENAAEAARAWQDVTAPPDFLDQLLGRLDGDFNRALSAGASVLCLRQFFRESWRAALSDAVAGRLAAVCATGRADVLPGLALIAASLSAPRLAGPLAQCLLLSQARALEPAVRSSCLLALARLARPSPQIAVADSDFAAASSYYLFMQGGAEGELAALAPAALAAPCVDISALLLYLGHAIFVEREIPSHLKGLINAQAMLRNIAIVLHRDGFTCLDRHFEYLTRAKHGQTMLILLKRHNAMEWMEDDESSSDFRVRLGEVPRDAIGQKAIHWHRLFVKDMQAVAMARSLLSENALLSRNDGSGAGLFNQVGGQQQRRVH